MSGWLEARVIENRHWTPALFSLRVECPEFSSRVRFEAGQFVRIALDMEPGNAGSRIARPFSFVNAPADPILEFYGIVVPEGSLSPRLAKLQPGDALYVADNPSGFLVLSEVPQAEDLWLFSTGTGIAPFLSILQAEEAWTRYRRIVLVHAVRQAAELVYGDLLEKFRRERPDQFRRVTFVSREAHPDSLAGRIPAALRDGRLEAAAGLNIAAERSQLMLCGNPDMLKDAVAALVERGLKKHRRRSPGQITVESFW